MRVDYSLRATEDLAEIWLYSSIRWSEKQADNYTEALLKAIDRIENNTRIGRSYQQYAAGVFGVQVNKHIILYQFLEETILIVRILHQRMDIPSKIKQ